MVRLDLITYWKTWKQNNTTDIIFQATGVYSHRPQAFLDNNPALFGTYGTVHYAGSDSVLMGSELSNYNSSYRSSYGPLIQIPVAIVPVAIPYRRSGVTDLNLTSAQLCDVFSGHVRTWGQLLGTDDSMPITVV